MAIPHYAPIANVMQIAVHNKVNQNYCDWQDQRYRPGDVAIGGEGDHLLDAGAYLTCPTYSTSILS